MDFESLIEAFAAGIYVLLGFVHFDLWWRDRSDRGPLWIVVAAAGALIVNLTWMAHRTLAGAHERELLVLNHGGVAITTVALYELAAGLARKPVGRLGRALQLAVFAAALLAAFGPSWAVLTPVAAGLLLIGAGARALRSATTRAPGALTFMHCYMFLIASLALDAAREAGLEVIPPDLPVIGFIVLFLGATTAIADRRQREYEELVRLRHDLEELVDERTAELSAANRQLEEMARSDWLTGLPNRRGFLAAVEAEERRSRRSGRCRRGGISAPSA